MYTHIILRIKLWERKKKIYDNFLSTRQKKWYLLLVRLPQYICFYLFIRITQIHILYILKSMNIAIRLSPQRPLNVYVEKIEN